MIFFCQNQITYALTKSIGVDKKNIITVISKKRITRSSGFTFFYNKTIALFFLLLSKITNIQIALPHTKTSKILKLIAIYGNNVSWIDDGMDTFRDKPKNVDLLLLKQNQKYYTFKHKINVANWVKKLCIIEVCQLQEIRQHEKPILTLKNHKNLIIESTGMDEVDTIDLGNTFYIRHSNITKNQTLNTQRSQEDFALGSNINVEDSALQFNGDIFIGETMVLIYLLSYLSDYSKLHVFLTQKQYENLTCLHHLLVKCHLKIKPNV